jgi:hypothetical protein
VGVTHLAAKAIVKNKLLYISSLSGSCVGLRRLKLGLFTIFRRYRSQVSYFFSFFFLLKMASRDEGYYDYIQVTSILKIEQQKMKTGLGKAFKLRSRYGNMSLNN